MDERRVQTEENLLQLEPDLSVDDHVETGVDEAVEVEQNHESVENSLIVLDSATRNRYEETTIGPGTHQES